jgi:uncharacterized protein
LLGQAGSNLRRTAELLYDLVAAWPDEGDIRQEINRCEHEGDRITRQLIHLLHRSRTAPFDREDMYALAGVIDDVVDNIEEGAEYLALYGIEAPMEQAQQIAGVLRDAARALAAALDSLEHLRGVEERIADVDRLEHEGDRLYREALAALFEGGIDPMLVLRWKDVFERLEEAIDACKHAANILQGVVVKYS